ncbi:alpha/beta hydrolase [Micromonospora sp. WMMD1082]|uniref:alpha/beta fold hydrolase n=1 Tax=Micromonospora sp. WMMD1082 TaxID=3016104 RepID=UPI0024165041|nr:alpha/beta hydrolase [Micromonospora sp. WMMD1082]MDG4796865.1 alpha/beta hydrolase [Micromonospora sp. WMMD1082]
MKPTIVLVHGAFAESASWSGVIARLRSAGHPVVAAGNPLRSLSGDAASVAALLATIDGPIVLVGHSYGGAVATNAAVDNDNVKALVYVAALAPDKGENVPDLTGKYPGATLGEHLYEVPLADGTADVYVDRDAYHEHFCADLTPEQAALDAATQRPFHSVAVNEGSGEPAWKTIPTWFIYPELDLAIPVEAFRFMAQRANARATVEVAGASHALPASQPEAVATFILEAAAAV